MLIFIHLLNVTFYYYFTVTLHPKCINTALPMAQFFIMCGKSNVLCHTTLYSPPWPQQWPKTQRSMWYSLWQLNYKRISSHGASSFLHSSVGFRKSFSAVYDCLLVMKILGVLHIYLYYRGRKLLCIQEFFVSQSSPEEITLFK